MLKKAIIFLLAITSLLVIATDKTYATSTQIMGPDIVFKDKNRFFTTAQILQLYAAPEGKSLEVITDNYTGYGDIPGIYQITIGIRLSTETRTIDVHVKNVVSDTAYAASYSNGKYQIYTTKNNVMKPTEIMMTISRIDENTKIDSKTGIIYGVNTYTENANSPGRYVYEFTAVQTNATQQYHSVEIIVSNIETLNLDYAFEDQGFNLKSVLTWLLVLSIVGVVGFIAIKFTKKFNRKVNHYK